MMLGIHLLKEVIGVTTFDLDTDMRFERIRLLEKKLWHITINNQYDM